MNDLVRMYLSNAVSCAAIASRPFEILCSGKICHVWWSAIDLSSASYTETLNHSCQRESDLDEFVDVIVKVNDLLMHADS